ncbi:SDR family NAD(P)-dependent oxidoreductase [Pedobacter panaciterrae]|jgi:Short-chain dehydrogenases of various substrate specificities|uniref:SDR family NAD(P)-dependent oxidoreductase n=1 Tax=Pedobacter panaciterrae TaxID=363849 RepID=UPI00155DD762|nr:SDR family NAD(P)-dependent oxidoreductase [Pedobacter panaciterrae]NQX52845.1 SDR family NAD(P)-dependent oxidoreductase [Pedobacter panaciterrae]
MEKVWFITGSSRGLGRSLTEAVLNSGDKVAATARDITQLNDLVTRFTDQILPIALDVTDYEQVYASVAEAAKHFGRIDVLVNNAGFGIIGAAEAYTDEQMRSQLETNLYAPIEITRAVLPYMRNQGEGRILQISSIGGRVGNAGLTMYQAAKFGLGGFTEALAKEVAPLGIYVTSVEPGGFRTDWAGASMTYAREIEGYEMVNQRTALFKGGKFVPVGDPEKAAKVMVELASHPAPPVHLVLGSEAIGMLNNANEVRQVEMEEWLDMSLSTDHDDSENFLASADGKWYISDVKRKQ